MSILRSFLPVTVFLFGIVLFSTLCRAQEEFRYSPIAETLFVKGLELYNAGEYENAAESFEIAVNINPVHQRTTASYLMAAKAWLQVQEQAQAMFLLSNLLKRFPESNYAQDAHFTLGTAYYLLNDNKAAVNEFLITIEINQDEHLTGRSKDLVDSLITFVLTPAERDELKNETGNEYVQSILERIAQTPPVEDQPIEQPQEPIVRKPKSRTIEIGALLPLMGSVQSSAVKRASEDILDGMKLALTPFNESDSDIEISLLVKDTERDTFPAIKFLHEFIGNENCLAVVGPLFSNTVFACAPHANDGKLPLITPTADAIGIAATGPYIFQTNADIALQGKAAARYIVDQMGLTNLAVIAPRDPQIRILTNEFIAEAKRLGATITANESYASSSDDLSKQFTALRQASAGAEPMVSFEKKISSAVRKKILATGFPETALDSLIDTKGRIPVSKLLGSNGLRKAEAMKLKIIDPRKAASKDMDTPVTTLQAIFAPVVSSEDLGVIASQVTYYNIKTQIFGNSEWYDEAQLEPQKRYTRNAMFCSGYFIDNEDLTIQSIRQQLKKKLTKYTVLGYDAMNLIIDCIKKGSRSREEIRACLSEIHDWPGLHSTINLSGGRVNKTVQILQFNGEVRRVTEITLSK